ncbi:unnamed protein product [Rotaria socialis]|uniref:Uncharacterized protein n=1 Tax=Rotaria socialis TaxID=392032 RepID=A0A821UTX1_9BILA|nr:unnamed protein product [Rotaria socialis]CAF4895531.1 unnamed protein product [Rotaria socialis]
MKHYENITNNFNFSRDLYPYIRVASLCDEYLFEHIFFIQIAQSFPFMKKLSITNRPEQNHKQSYKLMNNNQNLSIIKCNYFIELDIDRSHDNYIMKNFYVI